MRPIGLTPMIYRVWAKTRQPLITKWTRLIYGPRYASATECAWLTRVNQELTAHCRHSLGVVYLDCSKCYERVSHRLAAQAATACGFPGTLANLIFGLYSGTRHLLLHGAVSNPCGGNTGLIAGCGFAVHLLLSFLRDLGSAQVTTRIYVDDIALEVSAATPRAAVRILGNALPHVKVALTKRGMVSSDAKEQFFSPDKAVLRLWAVCHPRYQGKLGPCAKDLGVSQRPPWKKSLGRAARLADAKRKSRRIHSLRSGAKSKRLICRTSLHAGALYACEVDPPTRAQLHQLRSITAQALGHSGGNQAVQLRPLSLASHRCLSPAPNISSGSYPAGEGRC